MHLLAPFTSTISTNQRDICQIKLQHFDISSVGVSHMSHTLRASVTKQQLVAYIFAVKHRSKRCVLLIRLRVT
jgi:hypothetical protein